MLQSCGAPQHLSDKLGNDTAGRVEMGRKENDAILRVG